MLLHLPGHLSGHLLLLRLLLRLLDSAGWILRESWEEPKSILWLKDQRGICNEVELRVDLDSNDGWFHPALPHDGSIRVQRGQLRSS